jgi:hypothetical protein
VATLGPTNGVQRDGGEALVLAVLGQDLGRHREERLRKLLADDLRHAALVRVVEEREQEADGDSLDARGLELADLLARDALVERDEHLAVARDPLGHGQPVAAAGERIALPGEVLVVGEVQRLLVPRDVEDVAVALRGEHPDLRAVVLDDDVRGDRRAVEHLVQCGRGLPGLLRELLDAVDRPLGRILRRRRELVDEDLAALVVHVDEIGERPADVHAEALHGSSCVGVVPVRRCRRPHGHQTSRTILPKNSRLSMRSMAARVSSRG